MNTYEIIKELAKQKKISIRQLEMKFNKSNGYLAKWATNTPNSDELIKIADFFNVSVDYLLGREKEETNGPVSYFRIDTTNLTASEIHELQDELEEYQEFIKQKIKNKRNRMD